MTHRHKKHTLLLSVEKSFKDTFLHIFRNTTHIVTQEVTLRNNLYKSRVVATLQSMLYFRFQSRLRSLDNLWLHEVVPLLEFAYS